MLKLFRDQKGFTLVELMIVVVIVGILAAVAIPMYRGSVEKARASEAEAALGTIRSSERVYHAEHGVYYGADNASVTPNATGNELALDQLDLDGRYFSYECYTFDGAST
ncbi:MAG: prepilin-type N-terminal cleavage/methylation domain-containing protein, partial [Candidatus Latescibacteria bacterium]|nr:prepilin-type N-terminal cleavage/methylation domain-containing protein [Candidatus Latescibacterota bacterium]